MTDFVQSWVGNARNSEYGFFKAVAYALEQFGEKNNKPLYALIAFTNGKKFGSYKIEEGYTLTQYSVPLKRILNKALSDVKFIFKDGNAKVKVGENGGLNHDVLREMDELLSLYNGRIGVKSDAFKEMFPVVKSEPKQREDTSVVSSGIRAAKKNHISKEAYLKMCEALWNEVEVPTETKHDDH